VTGEKRTLTGSKLMIVPYSCTFEGIITGKYRATTKFHWRQAVEIGNETTLASERRRRLFSPGGLACGASGREGASAP